METLDEIIKRINPISNVDLDNFRDESRPDSVVTGEQLRELWEISEKGYEAMEKRNRNNPYGGIRWRNQFFEQYNKNTDEMINDLCTIIRLSRILEYTPDMSDHLYLLGKGNKMEELLLKFPELIRNKDLCKDEKVSFLYDLTSGIDCFFGSPSKIRDVQLAISNKNLRNRLIKRFAEKDEAWDLHGIEIILEEYQKIAQSSPSLEDTRFYKKFGCSNLKKRIYTNDKATINYAESLGVNFKAFMNLTDSSVVSKGLEMIVSDKSLIGRQGYNHVSNRMVEELGIKLRDISSLDTEIYSDEIAYILEEACSKDSKLKEKIKFVEDNANSSFRCKDNPNVSFKLATRDDYDLSLGDKCGDCTAKDGENKDWAYGWVADVNTQFLKLYHSGKFVGRLNLIIAESEREPIMLIDAIEFIPQAREVEKYDNNAREAFNSGLNKVKDIADGVGIKRIYANTFSNSSEVSSFVDNLGYAKEEVRFTLIRKNPLNEVAGIEETLDYGLQSHMGITNRRTLSNFEKFMNDIYLKIPENKDKISKARNSKDYGIISERVETELRIHQEELGFNIVDDNFNVSEALEILYGISNPRALYGLELSRIR